MKSLSMEEIRSLTSEFAYSDHKTGIVGGYCEEDFPFYYANDEFVKMLGYDSLEEMVAAIDGKVANTIHPDDMEQVSKDLGGSYYEGMTYETTYRMPKKDGTWFWTVDKGKVVHAEDGRLAIISMCSDMSRFVERQRELETKNTASDYLFQNLPGGYHRCAMDDEYSFLYVSERFLNLLGWTKEELETRFDNKFANLIHPEDKHLTDSYVDRIISGNLDDPYQEAMYRLQCKDGYRWFSDTTMKVTVGGETFFQGFITDISPFIMEKQKRFELIDSLGEVFDEICQVDLKEKKYQVLSGKHEGKAGNLNDLKNFIDKVHFEAEEKTKLLELWNNSVIEKNLRDKDKFSWDIKMDNGVWYTVSAIAQKREQDGTVIRILLASQNVTEQKKKELEYQGTLEEGLFAIADGFCKINLTKNMVPGAMYQIVDGVRYNLNKRLGIRENASFDEIVSACAKTIPEEGVEQFYKDLDRDTLLGRFQNGETQICFDFWTRTATYEPMLAEDHMELYCDSVTGDVMAINCVLDRTEQYRLQEQKQQLEEKTRELEKLLQVEKEYSAMLPVLRNVYDQIFAVDLETDTYYRIQSSSERESYAGSGGKARENFHRAMKLNVSDSYMQLVSDFFNFDTIADRLTDSDNIFTEYMDRKGNWKSTAFLVQERNITGKPTKILFTIRNINKQKKMESDRQRREEMKMQTMTEAIHGGFKLGKNDPQFTFIMVSEQLAKMFGYENAEEMMEVSGGCMAGLCNHEDAMRELPQAQAAVDAGKMYTMRYRVRCKDGSWKNIEDRGRLITNEKGEGEYWSFIVDQDQIVKTTEALEAARKANKELSEARNELKIARDKADAANEAKTQFLFNMSHDIRTPMNAMLGYNQLMKKKLTDPVLLDYQGKIEQSGNLLLSIINNVLDMARIESGKMELDENYVNVSEVSRELYHFFSVEAEKKHIAFSCEKDIIHEHVMCDITKVREICMNLISNAIKYTPSGKTITVKTSELPCDENGYVIIKTEVIDTGIGMSKEFLPHIFDAFERERNTTTGKVLGTGLGMSIVKRLVDFMGGIIEVESELGKGSRFTVTLKHRIADKIYYEKTEEVFGIDDIEEKLKGKHILLAEDNDLNAEIADIVLSNAGLIVDRVEDGVQCVAQIENHPSGTYDLILMDIQMPNMDGYKATQAIRRLSDKNKANIPIVAMTANAFEEDKQNAFKAGMNGHIAKPIDIGNVEKVLVSILN